MTPKEFERLARSIMTTRLGVALTEQALEQWPKRFDLVSADGRIVGDAKLYSMVKGKRLPPAKFATISEHIWFLKKIEADKKFLIFGNDQRVPIEWLKRWGRFVEDVDFYFLNPSGELSILKPPDAREKPPAQEVRP